MTMTTAPLFYCPIAGCESFPWDDPSELAAHMAEHMFPGAAVEAPAPVAESAPMPVRSFSPGGTATTVAARRPAPANPASDRQLGFIATLLSERPDFQAPDMSALSKGQASKLIERLLSTPKATAPKAGPALELEHGRVYAAADGSFIKVTRSKAGRLYGKALDGAGKFTEYRPGLLNQIARVITAEEAAAFGHLHHHCVFCGRGLSNEADGASVDVGYGPVCADKYGLPWG